MVNKHLVLSGIFGFGTMTFGLFAYAIKINPGQSNVGLYLGILSTLVIVILIGLFALLGVYLRHAKGATEVIQETHEKVHQLANGEMDAKIEKVVRRLLEEYISGGNNEMT